MKHLIISLILLTPITTFSQLKLLKCSSAYIDIAYYNDSNLTAYYSDPGFFLIQKRKGNQIQYRFRNDMYYCLNDTLYLFLTDTTLNQAHKVYQTIDSFHKSVGLRKTDSLYSKTFIRYRMFFPRITNYKHLLVKYNFSYRREDFFDSKGIPVKKIAAPIGYVSKGNVPE